MIFVIYAIDRPDAGPIREAHYPAHRAYLAQAPFPRLLSGPLTDDDGERMIGSMILVEAESRNHVERFFDDDPFVRNGVYEKRDVRVFRPRTGTLLPE